MLTKKKTMYKERGRDGSLQTTNVLGNSFLESDTGSRESKHRLALENC